MESGAEKAHETGQDAPIDDAADTQTATGDADDARVFGGATGPLIQIFAVGLPCAVGVAAMLCVGNLLAPESECDAASMAQSGEVTLPWCELATVGAVATLAVGVAAVVSVLIWRAVRRPRKNQPAEPGQPKSGAEDRLPSPPRPPVI